MAVRYYFTPHLEFELCTIYHALLNPYCPFMFEVRAKTQAEVSHETEENKTLYSTETMLKR